MERCSAPLPASAELQGRSAAVPHRAELRIPSWCRMMQDVLCWLGLLGAQPGAGCSPIPALLARASWSFASWLIGRAQSKMVLFLRTLCRCFQRWFLPAAHCVFPTIPCVNQGSRMSPGMACCYSWSWPGLAAAPPASPSPHGARCRPRSAAPLCDLTTCGNVTNKC